MCLTKEYGLLEVCCVDASSVLEKFKDKIGKYARHWPIVTFARLFVDALIPDANGVFLYVDPDVFVAEDIRDMFAADIEDFLFGAVPEADFQSSNGRYERLGFSKDIPFYFNAGVMLINMDAYRSIGGHKTALAMLDMLGDRLVTPDQDVLNFMGKGRTLALHPRWNHNDGLLVKQFTICGLGGHKYRARLGKEILEAIVSPGIIHYMGKNKPWHYNHRPERKRYARAMESLGWSTEDLRGKSFFQKVQLLFFDVLHWGLLRIAILRVWLGKTIKK